MHQCLCIEEIVRVIFDFVDEHEYHPARWIYVHQELSLKTLSALSRTCHAFKNPALDLLWREIPGLHVLIKSHMPSNLVKIKKSILYMTSLSQPKLEDWKRLDPYINRIKIIGSPLPFEKAEYLVLHLRSVLQPLSEYLRDHGPSAPGQSLLPHLAEVMWDGRWSRSPRSNDLFREMFIGPSLRSLQLTDVTPHNVLYFTELRTGFPQVSTSGSLRSLTMHAVGNLVELLMKHIRESIFKTTIQRFHHLEHISFTPALVCHDALTHLATLPTLTSLGLHFYQIGSNYGAAHVTDGSSGHAIRFSHLRKLSITIDVWHENLSLPFLDQYVDARMLEAATLTFIAPTPFVRTDAHFLEWLLHYLAPAAPTLHELSVYTGVAPALREMAPHWRYPTPDPAFHVAAFPGLLQFVRLRALRFEDHRAGALCSVTDGALHVLAHAFPDLELLSLVAPMLARYDARDDGVLPTLGGLLPLAERCRHLHTLRVPVRSAFGRRQETPSAARRCVSTVRTLALWATPIEAERDRREWDWAGTSPEGPDGSEESADACEDVATFLREMFPNVDDLRVVLPQDRACGLHREEDVRGWSEVLDRLTDTEVVGSITRRRVLV